MFRSPVVEKDVHLSGGVKVKEQVNNSLFFETILCILKISRKMDSDKIFNKIRTNLNCE